MKTVEDRGKQEPEGSVEQERAIGRGKEDESQRREGQEKLKGREREMELGWRGRRSQIKKCRRGTST